MNYTKKKKLIYKNVCIFYYSVHEIDLMLTHLESDESICYMEYDKTFQTIQVREM